MKRLHFIFAGLAVLAAVILLWIRDQPIPFDVFQTKHGSGLGEWPGKSSANVLKSSRPRTSRKLLPQVAMTAAKYEIDPVALNREREDPPFEFRGGQMTSGRIVDSQGNVLLESSDDNWIHGSEVSPDKTKVLVKRSNSFGGTSLVLDPSSGQQIDLPSRPPGANMFSLSWHWIGPNQLFGVSGVGKALHDGPHENCDNDDPIAQTNFYTFDLLTEQLSEVVMPPAVEQPVVNAVSVTSDGHIHLQYEDPHELTEHDLGWFKIGASN